MGPNIWPPNINYGPKFCLEIEDAITGIYIFEYTLDEVESNCEGAKQLF